MARSLDAVVGNAAGLELIVNSQASQRSGLVAKECERPGVAFAISEQSS